MVLRRPAALAPKPFAPPAGPLKILVAVGAPDEGQTAAVVLDQERELQNILDGVEEARRRENVVVRILEVGDPEEIARAIERDTYHVLHLSCHGLPGVLELADDEGRAVRVAPGDLLAKVQAQGRPLARTAALYAMCGRPGSPPRRSPPPGRPRPPPPAGGLPNQIALAVE